MKTFVRKVRGRVRRFRERWKRFARSLYSVREYRVGIVDLRRFYYTRVRRQLRTLGSELAFETTLSHNLPSLKWSNDRIALLLKPLSVIETLEPDSDILIIGPRNEHDLYYAQGQGFSARHVRGLDLISYSPRIDLGDMHDTSYADDSFDAVVIGWTLSYSRSPRQFAAEIARIVKDGGVVAIGVEYSTLHEEEERALTGYIIQEREFVAERINSVRQILELFGDQVGDVFFAHDAPAKRSHTPQGLVPNCSNVAAIFSVRKG